MTFDSSNRREFERLTTEDLIGRIRTAMESGCIRPCHVYDLMDEALDRLQKSEPKTETVPKEDNKSGYNVAAMREVLIKAKKAICHHAKCVCSSLSWENSNIQSNCADVLCTHRDLCEAKTAINAALSAPPRNCDVGTAEEQYARHDMYCNTQLTCKRCLREDAASMCVECFVQWSQMPYESEEK